MASGETIPYQLRPNKYIDRQIFMELLSKIVSYKAHGNYVYISMGGKHLVDLEAVYRKIGVSNLYSFDGNSDVVERQHCNLPHFKAVCENLHSSALAGSIDGIMAKFQPAEHMIVWMDYTNANRLAQLQEFGELLKRCRPGDVARITMNAHSPTLNTADWEKLGFASPAHKLAYSLRDQIGEYLPAEISALKKEEFPQALAGAIKMVASAASSETNLEFIPILLSSYADGQRMFTATVLTVEEGHKLPSGLEGWEFLAKNWSRVLEISVPDLSIREKVLIDKHLAKGPAAIIKAAKFKPISELDEAKIALQSYKKLHRFYPTFQAIGVQ